mgnify:CR=1 FL=1
MGNVWYDGWEKEEDLHHPILEKHKNLLERLIQDRVFRVGYADGTFYLLEECDQYFGCDLTKEEAKELSELFQEIAEIMSCTDKK